MSFGILRSGGYVPRTRLQKADIAAAHAWVNPGLKSLAKGERSMANWDEDSVTMSVEAARDCLNGRARDDIAAVYLASTSFPFLDRQNAGIVSSALDLPSGIVTLDHASSQRAGTSSLLTALAASTSGDGPILVVASDKRRTKAASSGELTVGDGAAAFLVGRGETVADFIGSHSESVDFIDHYRGENEAFDYHWEERWIREEGYKKIVPVAIKALLAKTGIEASSIRHFCFPAAMPNVAAMIAKDAGLPPASVRDNLQSVCGETGAAHPLLMLVHAIEDAKPGDRILVAGFGQGSDALLFEATRNAPKSTSLGVTGHLARRYPESRYSRFLALNDLMILDRGIRAEVDKQTGLTTHFRNRKMSQALVGGRCSACGTLQFPKTNICVSPNCGKVGTQVDEPFADKALKMKTYTADSLTYTPDPPNYFGMVAFEGGGQMMCDFADVDPGAKLDPGLPMRMMFRVKDHDTRRGFRRYFWKAAPI